MQPARTAEGLGGLQYERHQPEQALLYQIIAQYYLVFKESFETQGRSLPQYVQREFDEFLTCARGISASLHVIASIEEPAVIAHILKHLKQKEALQAGTQPHELPPERAPPVNSRPLRVY